ncbi:class II fructose-bisphosphate aldolase [Dictyobacter aurantiacus]|uniref:Tagatose-bisphosphate aldolase n=1 Tax=Dictyobacter aurantiacus TaxID=1936993 RepID=A0A401ZIV0_9CHLR|nr:class II fructose-bisphosphate aldolase [Dictyobacter aurantiacus]GCE06770.1 tagatose-bisphosphate aldolase [Dictyobacter aurantiacus]
MLAKTLELVTEARQHGVAVGAFNTYSLELTQAILGAAEQLKQPAILQLGVASVKTGGEPLVKATVLAAQNASVPVAVHLDHCADLDMIERCLAWGCASALADGSHLSFEENILLTRQAAALASSYGATIEAELGYLAGTEDGVTIEAIKASLTHPEQARTFVEATGASMLAVAIGNVHGFTPNPPPLDFELLSQIASQVDVPLILHGASGLGKESIQHAISLGVAKINVNTEVRTAFLTAIAAWGQRVGPTPDVRRRGQDWLDLMREATAAARAVVTEHMQTVAMMA